MRERKRSVSSNTTATLHAQGSSGRESRTRQKGNKARQKKENREGEEWELGQTHVPPASDPQANDSLVQEGVSKKVLTELILGSLYQPMRARKLRPLALLSKLGSKPSRHAPQKRDIPADFDIVRGSSSSQSASFRLGRGRGRTSASVEISDADLLLIRWVLPTSLGT